MYCTKCGNQIEDDSKFCEHCGEPVKVLTQEQLARATTQGQLAKAADTAKSNTPKKKKSPVLPVILVLTLGACAAFGIWYYTKNKTQTNEPAKWENNTVDAEKNQAAENGGNIADNEDIAGSADTPVVSEKVDPFEDVKVSFDAYNGTVFVTGPTSGPLSDAEYIALNNFDLKEGDSVTVKLTDYHNSDIKDYFIKHYGIELTCTEKDFICTSDDGCSVQPAEEAPVLTEEEPPAAEDTSEYILPESNSRYLTEADITGFDADTCRKARNEIFARHGRKFKDAGLQSYFDSKSWYTPTTDADSFSESVFNEYEKANKDLIAAYESKMGYR